MRTLILTMTIATLMVVGAGPASAANVFTPSVQSDGTGTGHYCTVVNKSTTANVVITSIEIIAPFVGVQASCGPDLLGPGQGTTCYIDDGGFYSYCKVVTSSKANTRANLMVLDSGFVASAAAEAK